MTKIVLEDVFWTTDIGLATALISVYPMVDIDTSNLKRIAFGFNDTYDLEEHVKAYWNKELKVEPQEFYTNLLMLRKRINQTLNN